MFWSVCIAKMNGGKENGVDGKLKWDGMGALFEHY